MKRTKKKAPKMDQTSQKPISVTIDGEPILESVLKASRDRRARFQA